MGTECEGTDMASFLRGHSYRASTLQPAMWPGSHRGKIKPCMTMTLFYIFWSIKAFEKTFCKF